MINHNIQELFDGTLGDEQSAELLHLLSVNPERRADFRRYIALNEAMRRDRAASSLSSDEDSEIWGVLAGLGGAAVTTTTGSNALNWIAKAAAVLVVGIAGYLLGSNSSTNVFIGRSQGSPSGAAATVIRQEAPASAPRSPLAPPQNAPQAEAPTSADVAPKVIYRDRIVYKYAPTHDDGGTIAIGDHLTSSDNLLVPNGANTPRIELSNGNGDNGNGDNGNGGAGTPPVLPPDVPQQSDGAATNSTPSSPAKVEARNGNASAPTLDPNSVLGGEKLRSSDQPSDPAADPVAASILRDGFEVGLSDHEGLISPVPSGEESDPSFSNRNIDLSYRILDGRFGVGARFGYGSFAMVTLGSTLRARSNAKGELASVETKLYPVLQPQKQFLTEFFLNYRLPVGGRFAIGLESSLGVSARHTKAGGDASLLWFFGEHVGMHAGAGLGYYWYDLTSANEEAIRNSPDNTSVVEMSDSYRGTVLEFKYGLFYHF